MMELTTGQCASLAIFALCALGFVGACVGWFTAGRSAAKPEIVKPSRLPVAMNEATRRLAVATIEKQRMDGGRWNGDGWRTGR